MDGKGGSSPLPEGWQSQTFDQVDEFRNGLNFVSSDEGELIKLVGVGDFQKHFKLPSTRSLASTRVKGAVQGSDVLRDKDLLFVRSNGNKELVGRCLVIQVGDERVSFSGFTIRARILSDEVLPEYIAAGFHSGLLREQLLNAGGGTNISNLSQKLLGSLRLLVPPLEEQRKIAEILSAWDEALEQGTRLLELKRERKRGLMQQLLTGKVRFKKFEGLEWRTISFEDTYKTVNGKKHQIQKTDYADTGTFPVIDQGQSQIAGFTDKPNAFDNLPVIIFGDHTRIIKWIDFPFVVGADGTQLLKTAHGIDQKFGFYLLQTAKLPNLGYSRHMRELKEKNFFIPTNFGEQQKIATVLSAADAEIDSLTAQLAALRSQKRGLMQRLLTGKTRVKTNGLSG